MATYKRDTAHDDWMRQRLAKAVEDLADGNAEKMGRMLGYQNGGFVREVLGGSKPVGRAIVQRMQSAPGGKGWFDGAPSPSALKRRTPPKFTPRAADIARRLDSLRDPKMQLAAFERITNVLAIYEAEQREAELEGALRG